MLISVWHGSWHEIWSYRGMCLSTENKGSEDLLLDHYLEILIRKRGALAGATAARSRGDVRPAADVRWLPYQPIVPPRRPSGRLHLRVILPGCQRVVVMAGLSLESGTIVLASELPRRPDDQAFSHRYKC